MDALACSAPPAQEVRLAARATLYALPVVIMDLTREQMLAYPGAEPNRFVNRPVLANAASRAVVRPNVDTLYSSAWLDLSAGPMILTLPASHGQFFVVQFMDAWTNVFADPGIRTLGDRPVTYAIAGPGWHGLLPPGTEELRAPTRTAWVLVRIYVPNRTDLAAARRFQSHLDIRPLTRLSDPLYHSVYPSAARGQAGHPTMLAVLRGMEAGSFFDRFIRLARINPPVPADPRFDAQVLEPFGLSPSRAQTKERTSCANRRALTAGYNLALRMLSHPDRLRGHRTTRVNGWNIPDADLQGTFGTHYSARAIVALYGLGEALRADAIYFKAVTDAHGNTLDGSREYRLTFLPGQTPPARAFWSLTVYDDQGYLVANAYDRNGISSADALRRNPDGSLVIDLRPHPPHSAERRANWIPTPAGHTYQITLRCYWPEAALLKGHWIPPAVTLASEHLAARTLTPTSPPIREDGAPRDPTYSLLSTWRSRR